jgi:Family of unknown function (DUF6463)
MSTAPLMLIAAWSLFALGVAHVVVTLVLFGRHLTTALKAGWVGQFQAPASRLVAFWFAEFGPLLMLAGQVAIHAIRRHDLALLQTVGLYLLVLGVFGASALPRSPFWGALLIGPVFLAGARGWIGPKLLGTSGGGWGTHLKRQYSGSGLATALRPGRPIVGNAAQRLDAAELPFHRPSAQVR